MATLEVQESTFRSLWESVPHHKPHGNYDVSDPLPIKVIFKHFLIQKKLHYTLFWKKYTSQK